MDDGDVADVPGSDEEVDEMRRDAEMSNVRSVFSRSSWNGDEVRLERRCPAGCSGRGAVRRLRGERGLGGASGVCRAARWLGWRGRRACGGSTALRFPAGASGGGRWLRLGDLLVDLMHEKSPNRVSEVRKGGRKVRSREGAAIAA
jgi:hypothetical protein